MRGLDASLKTSAAVVLAVAGAVVTWSVFTRKKRSRLPHLGSWIPYVGHGPAFFSASCVFCQRNKEKFGGNFSATIFGSQWIFLYNKEDIKSAMRAPEKHVSMYIAISRIAGNFFPQEDNREYKTPEIKAKLYRGSSPTHWDGVSTTPHIAQSMRSRKLRAWVPSLRKLLTTSFAALPDSGEIDVFKWCSDVVGAITIVAIFGDAVPQNKVKEFVKLFEEAEIDRGFSDPLMSLGTMFDVAVYGERQIYRQIRELIYPVLDKEIENVIAGAKELDDEPAMTSFVHSWFQIGNRDPTMLRAARRRIANDCLFFTFAATANSFANAAWLLFHVCRNTRGTGDRIREELERVKVIDDVDMLPELEKAILEITRLYNPGQSLRQLQQSWVMPSTGEEIPAGCMVCIPVFDAHRDPLLFADPLEFDPQRFDTNGRDERSNGLFLGFGAGVHPCTGRKFAVLETSLLVSEALKSFEWELVDDDTSAPAMLYAAVRCLGLTLVGDAAARRLEDPFTQASINVPRHPRLNPAQPNSIFRPLDPVRIRYKRK